MDCYKDLGNMFIEYCGCCFNDEPNIPPISPMAYMPYYNSYQNPQTYKDITPDKIIYSNLTEECRLLYTH